MKIPTWAELAACHGSNRLLADTDQKNPRYERFMDRRYNYATGDDRHAIRLIFTEKAKQSLPSPSSLRDGRFLWAKKLRFEGVDAETGMRKISFTTGKRKRRLTVLEDGVLCLPARLSVNNDKLLRNREIKLAMFSTVFSYAPALAMMFRDQKSFAQPDREQFFEEIRSLDPFRPGMLVAPRLGYFYPIGKPPSYDRENPGLQEFPYGIVLGTCPESPKSIFGREFYRVRFGGTTYNKVLALQMEIINEV
jgi:hypothetical protein